MKHNIIDLPDKILYAMDAYPDTARSINYVEAITDCRTLATQLLDVDQIIGIARSGMPYATWIAQMLNVDLGYYNPKGDILTTVGNPKKIAFIDETSEWGHTQNRIRTEMQKHPQIDYVIGSVWIDMFHPQFNGYEADDVVYGRKLTSWIIKYAGVEKNFTIDRAKFRSQ